MKLPKKAAKPEPMDSIEPECPPNIRPRDWNFLPVEKKRSLADRHAKRLRWAKRIAFLIGALCTTVVVIGICLIAAYAPVVFLWLCAVVALVGLIAAGVWAFWVFDENSRRNY